MDWIVNALVSVLLMLTPGSEPFRYEKPAPAGVVELVPATSGSVPR